MLSVLALAVLLVQSGDTGTAAPSRARAQGLLNEGTALYESGDFATALERFNAAYALYPSPKLWLNIGQALKDLDRPADALQAFERFVGAAADAPPETLGEASRSIAELRRQLGAWIVDSSLPGAEVMLDGRVVGLTPLPGPIWMTPGRHGIMVRHDGYLPLAITVNAVAGGMTKVPVHLRPLAQAAASHQLAAGVEQPVTRSVDDQSAPVYRRWYFWAMVGGIIAIGALAMRIAR
jgi:tetratricopeptide (TPR) repeat protein